MNSTTPVDPQERLRVRRLRIATIRRRVTATALATFALAFGTIAATGATGTPATTAATAAPAATTATTPAATGATGTPATAAATAAPAATTATTTAAAPTAVASVTTRQS